MLREAVEATNRVVARAERPPEPVNMDQEHADRIAAEMNVVDAPAQAARTA